MQRHFYLYFTLLILDKENMQMLAEKARNRWGYTDLWMQITVNCKIWYFLTSPIYQSPTPLPLTNFQFFSQTPKLRSRFWDQIFQSPSASSGFYKTPVMKNAHSFWKFFTAKSSLNYWPKNLFRSSPPHNLHHVCCCHRCQAHHAPLRQGPCSGRFL